MPLVVTGLVLGVGTGIFLLLVQLLPEGLSARPVSYFLRKYSTAFFVAAVIHWGFTWFSWNRRAARLRASGYPAVPGQPPGKITRWMALPNFLQSMAYSLEGERSLTLSMLERWTTNRRIYREQLDLLTLDSRGSESQRSEPWGLLSVAVLRQNLATLAEGYQALLARARPMATNPPAGGQANVLLELEAGLAERNVTLKRQSGPENVFAKLFLPALDHATEKAVRAQVDARCAIAACALERYRLRKGGYPESLADLVPEFLPEIVRDPMDGKPMRYARMPGGRFRLWSVGKNGLDDDGRLRPAGAMRQPGPTLDWPWPYPMAEGEASREP